MSNNYTSALYDEIGVQYDKTRKADSYIASRLIHHLSLPKKSRVLDIACGTGNYTIALKNSFKHMVGLDCSKQMLKRASKKSSDIEWSLGVAEDLPFESESFDGCFCTLAIHHFSDLFKAFCEMYRVLKSHGKLVIMTCTHQQIRSYWLYNYFPDVLENMTTYIPSFDIVIDYLCKAGFYVKSIEPYYITDDLTDYFLGCKKNQPELYLDEEFRNGMSVFAKKSDKATVQKCCDNLKFAIESGEFAEFSKNHKNPIGDYVFITVSKGL